MRKSRRGSKRSSWADRIAPDAPTWPPSAAEDFEKIADYLFERAPKHAPAVIRKIHDSCRLLLGFPEIGRLGNLEGTREFVVSPYVIVYQVRNGIV